MRALLRLALGVLALGFAGWGLWPTARADDVEVQPDVQAAVADLGSKAASVRLAALERLERILVDHPEHGPRCLARLKDVLRRRGRGERAQTLTVIALIPGPEAQGVWFERLDPEVESEPEVLAAAVAAAGLRKSDLDFERALVRFARDPDLAPVRRALALEALGHFDGPAALLILKTSRPGEVWVEAAGRALGLGRRRDEASLGVLVDLVAREDLAVRVHAWESLVARTGEPFGPDPDVWRAWWAERQKPKPAAVAEPDDPDGRYAPPRHVHVPTYYDVPIPRPRSRVVFCLDASQSMYGDGIASARRHLEKTLKEMPSTHAFDVIAFNEKVFPFAGRPIPADPVQKWRAIEWLDEFEPTSYTNIYDSVETAFQYMGRGTKPAADPVDLDMVFLLSDGAPNRGRYRNDDYVVKHIGRLSRRDVPVHTIGAGERVKGLLKRIAEATGGIFVDAFE